MYLWESHMYQVIVYRMFDSVYCAELTGGGVKHGV